MKTLSNNLFSEFCSGKGLLLLPFMFVILSFQSPTSLAEDGTLGRPVRIDGASQPAGNGIPVLACRGNCGPQLPTRPMSGPLGHVKMGMAFGLGSNVARDLGTPEPIIGGANVGLMGVFTALDGKQQISKFGATRGGIRTGVNFVKGAAIGMVSNEAAIQAEALCACLGGSDNLQEIAHYETEFLSAVALNRPMGLYVGGRILVEKSWEGGSVTANAIRKDPLQYTTVIADMMGVKEPCIAIRERNALLKQLSDPLNDPTVDYNLTLKSSRKFLYEK